MMEVYWNLAKAQRSQYMYFAMIAGVEAEKCMSQTNIYYRIFVPGVGME